GAYGELQEHRCRAEPCANDRTVEQNLEGLPFEGHGRKGQGNRDVGHEGGEEAERNDETGVAEQRSLGDPVTRERGRRGAPHGEILRVRRTKWAQASLYPSCAPGCC